MRHLLLLSTCVVMVAACKPMWDPTFNPSGYAYHHNKYNSPAGKHLESIGYEYSAARHEAVMSEWRDAVSDLVLRAEANGIKPVGPVALTTDMEDSAFQGAYAYVLGQELIDAGYTLTDDPMEEGATTLFYSAYDPDFGSDVPYQDLYNDDIPHYNTDGSFSPEHKTLELVLGTEIGEDLEMRVSETYDIPLHGYKTTGYAAPHARPKQAMPGEREPMEFSESADNGFND
jgi:hypothetical protein